MTTTQALLVGFGIVAVGAAVLMAAALVLGGRDDDEQGRPRG